MLGQATVAFERDEALGVLERDLPRGQGAHFNTASPSSGETGSAEQRAARPDVGDEFDLAPHGAPPTRFRVVRTFPVTFDAVRVGAEYEVIRFVRRRSFVHAGMVYVPIAVDDPDEWGAKIVF